MAKCKEEGFTPVRVGANTQFFQVIEIDRNNMHYKAYTATGDLYDSAIIEKDFTTGTKTIRQEIPDTEERTFDNTVEYKQDF